MLLYYTKFFREASVDGGLWTLNLVGAPVFLFTVSLTILVDFPSSSFWGEFLSTLFFGIIFSDYLVPVPKLGNLVGGFPALPIYGVPRLDKASF